MKLATIVLRAFGRIKGVAVAVGAGQLGGRVFLQPSQSTGLLVIKVSDTACTRNTTKFVAGARALGTSKPSNSRKCAAAAMAWVAA